MANAIHGVQVTAARSSLVKLGTRSARTERVGIDQSSAQESKLCSSAERQQWGGDRRLHRIRHLFFISETCGEQVTQRTCQWCPKPVRRRSSGVQHSQSGASRASRLES